MKHSLLKRTLLQTACLTMMVGGVAETALAIDEIIVTTRKRAENLQDVPVAVAAFTAETLDRQGLRDTKEILKLVPGVQFDNAFSPNDTRITIRGINNSRGRASTAVLIDGIDTSGESITVGGGSSLLNTRLLDLERVEVIKGPQSALYGRNAFAGAINYITKKPSMDGIEGNVSVDLAEYGIYEVRGAISGPVAEDKFALRLNAATYNNDGYYTNPVTGEDLNDSESHGVRLAALFTPNEDIEINAAVSYSEEKAGQRAEETYEASTFYLESVALPAGTLPEFTFFGNQDYGQFAGTIDDADESAVALSPSRRTGAAFEGSSDDTLRASLIVDWDLGPVALKSTTGYLNHEFSVSQDADFADGVGTFIDLFGIGFGVESDYSTENETEYWSQEITLSSTEWERGNWILGASGFWEDTDNIDTSLSWYGDPAFEGSLLGGVLCGMFSCNFDAAAAAGLTPKLTERTTTSWSIFGLVGFDITDALRVTAEARYVHDEIEVTTNTAINRVAQSLLNSDIATTNLLPGESLPVSDKVTSDTINPRLALDYRVNDDVLIYGSVAKGTKPAGFGTAQFSRPSDVRMKEEELWAYEIGAKTTWLDGTLQANLAAFYNVYTDRQISISITSTGGFLAAGVTNAGEAETMGAELDLLWQPVDNLQLGLGYAYVDAEFTDLDFAEIRGGTPTAKDQAHCGNVEGNCKGAEIGGVAEHALTLSGLYTQPIGNSDTELFIAANSQYRSERPLRNAVNTPYLDEKWNLDLQLGVQSDDWSLALYANNVLDDETPSWAQFVNDIHNGNYGGAMGGQPRDDAVYAFLPTPRVIGVRANIKFGQ